MTENEVNEELIKVKELLIMEKNEELKQYQQKLESTSYFNRRKQGICWYPIRIEKSNYDASERLQITIERPPEHNEAHLFQVGNLVNVFSSDIVEGADYEPVNGVISFLRSHEMVIVLSCDDLPDWTQVGKLGVQLMFDENAYRQMEMGMDQLIKGARERTTALKQLLLGNKEPAFENMEPIEVPELNESQNRALNKILSAKDVAIIHGPPGTGKTTTLIQGILHLLKREKQILVCAPSNAAVDLLAEKLIQEGINTLRLGHPARVNDDILSSTMDARISNHKDFKELKTIKKEAEEYRRMARRYKRNFGYDERQQRKLLRQEAKRYIDEAKKLAAFISDDIIEKAQVITTTLVGAARHELAGREFETVFIDEAAQALEAACWIPIMKANKVILAGDHFQLPPTIQSIEAANKGMSVTLFEKIIERKAVDVMLEEQYRMNETIMNFSNRHFYKNKLIANAHVAEWSVYENDKPLEFLDTAGTGFFEQNNRESRSVSNNEEGDLLFKHLNFYLDEIKANGQLKEISRIGIISPYKGQVNWLKENIKSRFEKSDDLPRIVINTIDSFQGQECDVIYISLVRSNDDGVIGFLKDERRMNVAMTRARKKLVIIGDSATICSNSFYEKFVDYANEVEAYRSAFELMY